MDRILLDIPTTIPTMAADCITLTNNMNDLWLTNAKIIAISFLCIGVIIGAIFGYLYQEKYGIQ